MKNLILSLLVALPCLFANAQSVEELKNEIQTLKNENAKLKSSITKINDDHIKALKIDFDTISKLRTELRDLKKEIKSKSSQKTSQTATVSQKNLENNSKPIEYKPIIRSAKPSNQDTQPPQNEKKEKSFWDTAFPF